MVGYGLLDLAGRVGVDGDAAFGRGEHGDSLGLADGHSGADVAGDERLFDCHCVGAAVADAGEQGVVEGAEALCERHGAGGGQHIKAHKCVGVGAAVHNANAHIIGAGVNAQDTQGGDYSSRYWSNTSSGKSALE